LGVAMLVVTDGEGCMKTDLLRGKYNT